MQLSEVINIYNQPSVTWVTKICATLSVHTVNNIIYPRCVSIVLTTNDGNLYFDLLVRSALCSTVSNMANDTFLHEHKYYVMHIQICIVWLISEVIGPILTDTFFTMYIQRQYNKCEKQRQYCANSQEQTTGKEQVSREL